MAIAFTTGTINEPDAGSVGLAMVEQIRDDVTAHVAWELVEEFTPSGGAVRWYVLKCLAAESGLPEDFFVVIGRTLGSGELRFAIGEGYDDSTHTFSLYGMSGGVFGQPFNADGCAIFNYVLGVAQSSGGGTDPQFMNWIPSGTSTKWWITVDGDGFTVAFNGASNSFVHIGAYIPLTELPIPMPIQMIGSTGSNSGSITRNPAVASTSESSYALTTVAGGGTVGYTGAVLGFVSDLRLADKLQGDQRAVAEQGMVITPSISQVVAGYVLGKQKRMRIGGFNASPAGFAFGDAYVLDGRLWVPYLPADFRFWDTGVAA